MGYARRGDRMSTVLCAAAGHGLGTNGRTLWMDKGDNRAEGDIGGDFATGHYKGQCARNEYMAGVAYTTRAFSNGKPAAILCMS